MRTMQSGRPRHGTGRCAEGRVCAREVRLLLLASAPGRSGCALWWLASHD